MSRTQQSIVVNVLTLGGSGVLQRVASLGGFLLLVRYLSLADYGLLNLLLALIAPAYAIATLGLGGIVSAEIAVARGRGQIARIHDIAREYLYLNAGLFLPLAALFFLLKDILISRGLLPAAAEPYLLILAVYMVFHLVLSYTTLLLRCYERFVAIATIETGELVIRLILLAAIFFMTGLSLANVFIAYTAAKLAAALISLVFTRPVVREIIAAGRLAHGQLREAVRTYAKWTIVRNVISQFSGSLELWLINFFVSTEAVAVYNVALKGLSFIAKAMPLSNVIEPIIQRKIDDREYISLLIKKARKYYLIYYTIAIVGIFLFMRPFLGQFAPQYVGGVAVFYILAFKQWSAALSTGQLPILYAMRRQRFLFIQFILAFVLGNIVLNAAMLYLFGINGLAVAVVFETYVTTIFKEWYIRSRFDLHLLSPRDYIRYDYYDRLIVGKITGALRKLLSPALRGGA